MTELTRAAVLPGLTFRRWLAGLAVAAVAWVAVYSQLIPFADWVVAIQRGGVVSADLDRPTWPERFASAWSSVKEIVGRVWPYVMVGIAIGVGIVATGILLVGYVFNAIL